MTDTIIHDPALRARVRQTIVSMRLAGCTPRAIEHAVSAIHREAGVPAMIADRYAREDVKQASKQIRGEEVQMLLRDGIETLHGLYGYCESPEEFITIARELRQYLSTVTAIGVAEQAPRKASIADIAALLGDDE